MNGLGPKPVHNTRHKWLTAKYSQLDYIKESKSLSNAMCRCAVQI